MARHWDGSWVVLAAADKLALSSPQPSRCACCVVRRAIVVVPVLVGYVVARSL